MIENVILITVDSLRADHLGCYGYHRKTTPYLDNIAQKGILFNQAFSNAPGTSTSFPSMLTSTYPLQYEFNIRLSPERIMISEVLKENGYLTGAFHCNPYLSSFYGYNRGFDVFKDFLFESYGMREKIEGKDAHIFIKNTGKEIKNILGEQNFIYKIIKRSYSSVMRKNRVKNSLEIETKYANAEIINKEAIAWLRNIENKKFFIWIHYMDVHIPYIPPQKYLSYNKKKVRLLNRKIYRQLKVKHANISSRALKQIIDLYDAEIKYVDDLIAAFLKKVENLNLLDNTLVVITSDHGDEFLEHGNISHTAKLYDELLHVPLIFYSAEFGKSIVIDDLVRLIDLSPTIIEILGIKKPKEWLGESLLPIIKIGKREQDISVISEINLHNGRKTSYRTRQWKFILTEENKEKRIFELYNIKEDSKESHNLADERPDLVKEFSSKIMEHKLREIRLSKDAEIKKEIKVGIKKLKVKKLL